MHATCVGVDGELEVKNVAPVTIGVATGVEFVSLNLSTIAWMYALQLIEIVHVVQLCEIWNPRNQRMGPLSVISQ